MKRILFAVMLLAAPAALAAETAPLAKAPAPVAGPVIVQVGDSALTLAAIEQLPLRQSRMANPWSPDGALWLGVRLADLLAAHGLAGRDVALRAKDNYTIRLKPTDITGDEPLLATRVDGKPLDPTTTGPLMLLWPAQAEKVMAKTAPDSNWIWGIVEIKAAP
ncbi:molybdopterin-dependent oxidoreductase [Magnetospirillum sulfuroxidans]|uniref:Molybdopterin-dependent oxidoreductase n=1 Tax=Magnetospirillum sulfuroxidans TaxID=611300 RepID=A0ABS5IDT2_9PROT|nr:molybdopterin-dependent oxidoreductase [Magnetospirillum sulfuroxidans]MBR9972575.1 molybdopterin-dependent oxidoreductase [Magnetospirillum sulfuroxidans]